MRSVALIAFTRAGCALAATLAHELPLQEGLQGAACAASGPERFASETGVEAYADLATWTASHFACDDALVFVGATGIAVRAIAGHVRDKLSDPAVVSVDEAGRFAVPLLSGHVGGANALACAIAGITQGQAVVSTATDVNGLFAVDEWAARLGLAIVERTVAKEVSAALLEGRAVGFANGLDMQLGIQLASGMQLAPGVVEGPAEIGFAVTIDEDFQPFARTLHLVPHVATVGVGCRRGTDPAVLASAVHQALAQAHVSARAVASLATIDLKADERAVIELAEREGWPLKCYSADELAAVDGAFPHSDFVERTVGVGNVCERAACASGATLVLERQADRGVTVAVAVDKAALAGKDWRMHG